MKKFLAIFLGSATDTAMKNWLALDPEIRREKEKSGISAWKNWVNKNDNIIDGGSPIGKTKRVDASGISDTKNLITGYTIVEAESQEAAAKLFVDHPHFTMFPGESVEVMECLPIPENM
ncbi:MAG: hypothetical protein V4501_07710 [Pseudomonadota bacterium]